MTMRVHYTLGPYESYHSSGMLNKLALKDAGAHLCDVLEDAEIFIFHGDVRDIPTLLMKHPELAERYVVAYSVWETDELPDALRYNLALADEIWTASDYCKEILLKYHDNVHVVPHIVEPGDPPDRDVARLRQIYGIKEHDFVYYAIVSSVHKRKNVTGLYAAIAEILKKTDAKIILKTDIDLPIENLQHPDRVFNMVGRLPKETIEALHVIGHCFISAHHSEGWGLCLSDAMAHGNLVVGTGFSGNMHFMNDGNSLPVKYREVEAKADFIWGNGGKWAEIDLNDFVAQCVRAKQDWEALAPIRTAALNIGKDFGRNTATKAMRERLHEIRAKM